MTPTATRVVTVSRSYGSGGSALARATGEVLGWRVVDREVVERVARALRVPEAEVEARDEHVRSLAERVAASLAGSFPELIPPPQLPTVDEGEVADLAEAVLAEAARGEPAVLVGHGGMCLFRDRDDAVHLRVTAPVDHRVRQVAARLGLSPEEAAEEVASRDRQRAEFIRRRFGCPWDETGLYHLVLDTSRVPVPQGARVVEALVRAREAAG